MTSSLIYRSMCMCGPTFNFQGHIRASGRSIIWATYLIFYFLKVSRYSGDFYITWYVVLVIDTTKSVVFYRSEWGHFVFVKDGLEPKVFYLLGGAFIHSKGGRPVSRRVCGLRTLPCKHSSEVPLRFMVGDCEHHCPIPSRPIGPGSVIVYDEADGSHRKSLWKRALDISSNIQLRMYGCKAIGSPLPAPRG